MNKVVGEKKAAHDRISWTAFYINMLPFGVCSAYFKLLLSHGHC